MEVLTFTCSICGDSSTDICVMCTRDACTNHLCQRCHCCSDCCGCDMPLTAETQQQPASVDESPGTPELVTASLGSESV